MAPSQARRWTSLIKRAKRSSRRFINDRTRTPVSDSTAAEDLAEYVIQYWRATLTLSKLLVIWAAPVGLG